MRRKLLSVMLAATMVVGLTGCGSGSKDSGSSTTSKGDSSAEGKVVNIYTWNEEFIDRYKAYAQDLEKKHGVKVQFVTVANENNAYQDNLDNALKEQASASDDEKVDVFLMEADYASKYTKSDYTLDVVNDIGLTEDDLKDQYQYTKDVVTVDGKLKAVTWQATPGMFVYRRSAAKKILGTDDPKKVQKQLSDWDKFDAVAQKAKEKGYAMLSGYDDSYRVFSSHVSAPWVGGDDGKTIIIDDNIWKWVEQTKNYTDKGYNNKTTLWSDDWSADQGPGAKVFGYFYSTWGIDFTLKNNAKGGEKFPDKVGSGDFGDFATCYGPSGFYWGGTWIAAANGTDNIPFIKDLMLRLTCDADTMKKISKDTLDFTNNQPAMEAYAKSDYKSDFLGGQNNFELYAEIAPTIDMSNISDYDQGLNEAFQNAFHDYFEGKVDKDTALQNFYKAAKEKYPSLHEPEKD